MDNKPPPTVFAIRCITDTLHGLREGLSLFSGKSRVAVIFSISESTDYYIFDPQNLLDEHAAKLAHFFSRNIKENQVDSLTTTLLAQTPPTVELKIDGLISRRGSSASISDQIWFTEHHPSICSTGPTKRWLDHTIQCISQDLTAIPDLYTGISGNYLREYATHAICDHIVDKFNTNLGENNDIDTYSILNAILGISQTIEEGAKAVGRIIFVEPKKVLPQVFFLAKFVEDQQPQLKNHKHVRKVLQAVENSEGCLVSDGVSILGICGSEIPQNALATTFHGKIGFISYNNETVCSFNDGGYCANTHRAKLAEVEELLLDYPLTTTTRFDIFKVIQDLVHNAQDKGFGCCFVIDLHDSPISIAGQSLTPPLDLLQFPKLKLAGALSKVDGALRIRSDLKLYDFACLLDGYRLGIENRARGARYNSALRFSYHYPKSIVVVVSSDRPVSIIHRGKEFFSKSSYALEETCMLRPEKVEDWLRNKEGEEY